MSNNKNPGVSTESSLISAPCAERLEQIKARVVLIESCLKAGRLTWAVETARELALSGTDLHELLKAEAAPAPQAVATPAVAPGPEAVSAPGALPSTEALAPPAVSTPAAAASGSGRVYTPPSPSQVQRALNKMFGHLPEAGDTGDVTVVSFNGHLLDLPKAQRLVEPLKWFIRRGHVILFQETNKDALKYLSNETGYGLNVSHRNERGQAVGVLYHPRIKWLGQPYYHDYLTDIPGHPEWKTSLRPALQRTVRDAASGAEWTFIDVHTKSNIGGPEETAPIRRLQFEMLMADLERQETAGTVLGATIIGGDMNAPINLASTTEIEPLLEAGYALVPNPENRSTYFYKGEAKGQFDGFFAKGFAEGVLSPVWIPLPLETKGERWFYSELTDHMPAFATIKVS